MESSVSAAPRVTIVIITYNSAGTLPSLFDSLWLELQAVGPFELFVVDNASTDGTCELVSQTMAMARDRFSFQEGDLVLICNSANEGYARANNQAIVRARGHAVLLLNPDTRLAPGAILNALCFLESHSDVGIVGARVRLANGKLDSPCRRSFKTPEIYVYQWTGLSRLFPRSRRFGRYYLSFLDELQTTDVDAVIGAFMLVRREVVDAIGLLDEGFFMYCEDEDWCFRAKQAGWRVIYYPESVVWHLKGRSVQQQAARMLVEWHRSIFRFHRKNLAANYSPAVNGFVYAGFFIGLGVALLKHSLVRMVPHSRGQVPQFDDYKSFGGPEMIIGGGSEPGEKVVLCAHPPTSASTLTVKRLMDIALACLLLVLFAPLMAMIAVAIKLTSPGPVFYAWYVVGRNGKRFTGYKFRTMVVNADELKSQLLDKNEMTGPVFKLKDDPRLTPVGRILRKFSLDELPQLWSVLKGNMSLVGPRPVGPHEWEHFEDWQRRKLSVTPGMICLWHIRGKPSEFNEWIKLDLEYIDNWSLWLDIKLLFGAAWYVVSGKNY